MEGAAGLASRSAQRAGAGMIHRGSPGLAAGEHPPGEAVSVGLPSTGFATVVVGELARFKALVLGPGLGRSDGVGAEVRALVSAASTPTVIDADGLYALGDTGLAAAVIRARPPGAAPVVLTPHDGEFARLAGAPPGEDRVAAARSMAASCGAVVLLKGSTTVVAAPDGRVLFAAAGDARLATAGTGDVLSGVIGAFLAAGVPPLEAAGLGAHVHGRAARSGYDFGLVAGDLPDLVARFLSGERQGPGVS
jgi:NAD(P)H-hydrate epimerase